MKIDVTINSKDRYPDGFAKVSVNINDLSIRRELDISFGNLYRSCGLTDTTVLDFLLFASVCYVIDKSVSRKETFDNWTREFEVNIPVVEPEKWLEILKDLKGMVGFLTGDIWKFSFYQSDVRLFRKPTTWRRRRPKYRLKRSPNAVCLFSGGLDSLIGAINLLAENENNSLLLMGHYDFAGPKSDQEKLFESIWSEYPNRAYPLHIRVAHYPPKANETTLRSRSLVFIALGIYAAKRFGNEIPLYAPENGLIALNIPLTPGRSGSCSTRTMHPFYLEQLRMNLQKLGINNPIINSFEFQTKGECYVNCQNADLLKSIVNDSVSCSHATRRQNWIRKGVSHCGYCIPCIIRRAAIHKAGFDNGKDYGFDICEGELTIDESGESANDLRAITDFINKKNTTNDLARFIRLVANDSKIKEHSEMANRGFKEIRSLFIEKGNENLKKFLNIVI